MRKLIISIFLAFLCAFAFAGCRCVKGFWHTIAWGETISSIAQKYETDPCVLARVNAINNPDKIVAHRKIWIPGYKLVRARVYIVKRGDYLLGIANRFNADVWAIASVNCIFDLNTIYPGQRIYVPLEKI
jgi:LysM repeat protein